MFLHALFTAIFAEPASTIKLIFNRIAGKEDLQTLRDGLVLFFLRYMVPPKSAARASDDPAAAAQRERVRSGVRLAKAAMEDEEAVKVEAERKKNKAKKKERSEWEGAFT